MTRRVLMTADTVGGVWTYAVELIAGLPHVEFLLATMGRPLSPSQRAQIRPLGNVLVEESRYALEWMPEAWDDVERAGDWLLRLARSFVPDVVHLNGYAHGALPFAAPKLVVAHSCVYSWWEAVRGGAPPREWDEYHARVEAGLRGASFVAAPTQAMLRALERHYAFETPRAAIHNGAATVPHDALEKEPLVVTAGRLWDEAKNVRMLMEARAYFDWPLHVAGEGDAAADGVVAHGLLPREDVQSLFARASIFAEPALYEPFGLSILEAAHAGCALVLGDIDSLRELWTGAAVFVPPRDAVAIGEAIAALTRQPAVRQSLARRARARAAAFPLTRFADRYAALYERLATKKETESRHEDRAVLPLARV